MATGSVFANASDDEQLYVRIENFSQNRNLYKAPTDLFGKVTKGDEVLLVRIKTQSFPSRLGNTNNLPELKKASVNKHLIRKNLTIEGAKTQKTELFVRIGGPEWLPKLRFDDYNAVILS